MIGDRKKIEDFFLSIKEGTPVVVEFGGGDLPGVWTGVFDGKDVAGRVLLLELTSADGKVRLPSLTRIAVERIQSACKPKEDGSTVLDESTAGGGE